MDLASKHFLDFSRTRHTELFDAERPAWEALKRLPDFFSGFVSGGNHGTCVGNPYIADDVEIGEGTVIEPGAVIFGPTIIGKNCTVRPGAYIRGNVIVGDNVFLGNSSEFKNCIIFDEAEIPHWNYVGDSVLGFRAHLGAGVILANFRLDRDLGGISISAEGGAIPTGLDKLGAVIGDRTDIGSNSVMGPGSVIGRDCRFYPGTSWRGGILEHDRIVKVRQTIEIVERR